MDFERIIQKWPFSFHNTFAAMKSRLEGGEVIIAATWGACGLNKTKAGILAVTDRRIIRYSRSMLREEMLTCPYGSINFIDDSRRMFNDRRIVIHFLKGFMTFHPSSREEYKASFEKVMDEINKRTNISSPATSDPESAPLPDNESGGSSTDLLIKLADLHKSGILTDEEFQIKKSEILSRI
jgi:hypothetical protein